MAEGQSMTVADDVAKTMDGRLEDFVREAFALVALVALMDAEISSEIGAGLGEVAPESRLTHRNGYRPRAWETRVGELELLIPKKRQGASYFPSFLEPRPTRTTPIEGTHTACRRSPSGPSGAEPPTPHRRALTVTPQQTT